MSTSLLEGMWPASARPDDCGCASGSGSGGNALAGPSVAPRSPLRLVLVEDRLEDALLMIREIRAAGFDPAWTRVDNRDDFLAVIGSDVDVILADYRLPQFDAHAVLELVREHGLDIPVVVVTGSLGDEAASDCLSRGAADYVLKDRLKRLGSAVHGVVERRRCLRRATETSDALRDVQQRFHLATMTTDDVLRDWDLKAGRVDWSEAIRDLLGDPDAALRTDAHWWLERIDPADRARVAAGIEAALAGGTPSWSDEYRVGVAGGRSILVAERSLIQRDASGTALRLVGSIRDVTARRQAEAEIRRLNETLHERVRRLDALRRIDRSIAAGGDLPRTLDLILQHVLIHLGAAAARLFISSGRGGVARTACLDRRCLEGLEDRDGNALGIEAAERVVRQREELHYPDLAGLAGADPWADRLRDLGFGAYHALPLGAKGQTCGVLEIFRLDRRAADPEWHDFARALAGQAAIAVVNAALLEGLHSTNAELTRAYDATIEGWARVLDLRDHETEGHSRRVTELTVQVARAMGIEGEALTHLRRGALLHDIGKMGIPDRVLRKPGPLTDSERAEMRRHPELAWRMLSPIAFLRPALDIPLRHHERWDGTGYPGGLKGEAIPLAARVFAAVDIWDALSYERPYRKAWPRRKVVEHLRALAGSHLDPEVVRVFLDLVGPVGAAEATGPEDDATPADAEPTPPRVRPRRANGAVRVALRIGTRSRRGTHRRR